MANGTRGAVGKTIANPISAHNSNGVVTSPEPQVVPTKVNMKKQKRRAKEAAKRKEQEQAQHAPGGALANVQQESLSHNNKHQSNLKTTKQNIHEHVEYDDDAYGDQEPYDDDQYYSEDDPAYHQHYDPAYPTGMPPSHPAMNGARKKSKKKKKNADPYADTNHHHYHPATHAPPPPPPPPPTSSAAVRAGHRTGRGDRIWNTSTQEERERIKEFWLSLREEDRRSLVKVEKEAVLKKMKEQQKHSCSCTVCGRKRTAIEEELEVLYDAYYEELEQLPPDRMPALIHTPPPRGHVEELPDDEEEEEDDPDEDDYSDEDYDDDEDDYSDEEPEDLPRASADFFSFGNSLTVKGGILTVADDLLKNDGKKFIEMMEQLAERRMQREEEAQYAAATHPSSYNDYRHNHGGLEDEEFEEDEEDDYDSQEDFEDEEEDMDTMTEEQRMQEGRRMFQIFAARMFEQRVLSAYREKVASERQKKLLEELEEEVGMDAAREAKKAKDAEKRKQKKQQQKQKQAEEKAKKEAEKAEREAAAKAEQEKKSEELRRKKEEQRIKKEEQRKAQEAEQARKTAEKLKRQKEEQERRQEIERKAREQKEAERKTREEQKKKERDEREAREREARERKTKVEQERKERELREKAEGERSRKEISIAQQVSTVQQAAQAAKRAVAPPVAPIPLSLTKQPSNLSSPYIQAAVPKAPTPVRPRQGSQQGSSKDQSPKTPAALAGQVKSGSPGAVGGNPQSNQNVPLAPKAILSRPPSQPPHSAVHLPNMMSPLNVAPPSGMPLPQGGTFGMPPGMNGFHPGQPPMMSGMGQRTPMAPGMFSPPQQIGNPFPRQFAPPNGMPGLPPGMGAPGMQPFGRGLPDGPPGFGNQMPPFGTFADTMPARTVPGQQHSRQQSGSSASVEPQPPVGAAPTQPIRPPAPIKRPSSVKPQDQMRGKTQDVDDLANHLGSSALLDDDESPEPDYSDRRPSMPPGLAQNIGSGFRAPPGFPNHANSSRILDGFGNASNTWGTPGSIGIPFGTPSIPSSSGWGGSPTSAWPSNNAFGLGLGGPPGMSSRPRHQSIRIGIVDTYKAMGNAGKATMDSFIEAKAIFNQLSTLRVVPPVSEADIRDLLDTEGTPQNGGGSFQLRRVGEGDLDVLVKWVADDGRHMVGGGDIGGQIGSPIVGPTHLGSASTTPFGSLRGFPGLAGGGLSGLGQGL